MDKKLEALVDTKKKEMDLLYFDRYSPLFHDAYHFLSNKKAILYGGTALNELMPTTLKFYEPYALPDIDVLSPNAEQLAREMVRFYKKQHHEAVSFTEALHPGTYKVYADGVQVADITQCSHRTYRMLLKQCVRSPQWKIKVAPPVYLRMTLHKILSQPMDAHRWANARERLQRFYKVFPLSSCSLPDNNENPDRQDMVQRVYEGMPPETVFFGDKELGFLLGKPVVSPLPLRMMTHQNLREVSAMLREAIPDLHVSPPFPSDELVEPFLLLSHRGKPLGVVFQLSSCVAFHEYKRQRVAGIHTILDMVLSMSLSPYFKKQKDFLQCLSEELSRLQQKPSRKKLLDQLTPECYGPSIGIATMRRERAKRVLKRKKGLPVSIY